MKVGSTEADEKAGEGRAHSVYAIYDPQTKYHSLSLPPVN